MSGGGDTVRFGVFEADLQARELRKQGVRIKLRDQPFQILSLLLARPGQVVSRDELRKTLWPADTFVDFDHGLQRKTLNGGSFKNKDQLREAIEAFIKRHNERAKPFRWRKREVKGSQLRNTIINLRN